MNPTESSPSPTTVLVVDDIAANRDLLRQTLEPHGYEVLLAPSGDTPPRGFEPAPEEPAPEPLEPEADDDPFGGDEPFADEDAERHPDDDENDEEGDVLEDTPDFLQETPEHDRLWFEQKPPRDFDFD